MHSSRAEVAHASPGHPAALMQESIADSPESDPLQELKSGERPEEMEGKRTPQDPDMQQNAQPEPLPSGPLQGPLLVQEPGPLRGLSDHALTTVGLHQQAEPVSVAGVASQASGPTEECLTQQQGGASSRPLREGGVGGRSLARSPGGVGGVVNAAQGRERTEAARRGTRNSLLLSLHRVAVTDLPEFQDLPIEEQSHQHDMTAELAENAPVP